MPDMYKKYKEEIIPELLNQLGYKNRMQAPKLKKIVISSGVGTGMERDAFDEAVDHISIITGQRPVIAKAKKNVANFKLRRGMPVGVMVSLRGLRMYEFYDRLVHNALPRVRDFRGVSPKGFDGSGNYNLGIDDLSVFTEVDLDKVKRQLGFNIAIVTSAKTDNEAKELLNMMEMPFAS